MATSPKGDFVLETPIAMIPITYKIDLIDHFRIKKLVRRVAMGEPERIGKCAIAVYIGDKWCDGGNEKDNLCKGCPLLAKKEKKE